MRRRNYRVQVVPGLVARGEVGEGALPFDLLPQLGHVGVALRGGGSHDAQRAVDVVDGHHCNREKGGGGLRVSFRQPCCAVGDTAHGLPQDTELLILAIKLEGPPVAQEGWPFEWQLMKHYWK